MVNSFVFIQCPWQRKVTELFLTGTPCSLRPSNKCEAHYDHMVLFTEFYEDIAQKTPQTISNRHWIRDLEFRRHHIWCLFFKFFQVLLDFAFNYSENKNQTPRHMNQRFVCLSVYYAAKMLKPPWKASSVFISVLYSLA